MALEVCKRKTRAIRKKMEANPLISIPWSPDDSPKGLYRKLLLRRRPGLKPGDALPKLRCEAHAICANVAQLQQYRSVCALTDETTPLLFPHAMLGSAHLMMLSHDAFPLGSSGLLHLRNHCISHEEFELSKPFDVCCELSRQRHVEKGLEFDFDTTVRVDGTTAWSSVSTFLKRMRNSEAIEESPLANAIPKNDGKCVASTEFTLPSDIGKQYARVSGDFNPIHVSNLAAKLFGFKKAIAHGMWTVARSLGELNRLESPYRLDVAFKGPMFVGAKATLQRFEDGGIKVFCGDNPRPVIIGVYRSTSDSDRIVG